LTEKDTSVERGTRSKGKRSILRLLQSLTVLLIVWLIGRPHEVFGLDVAALPPIGNLLIAPILAMLLWTWRDARNLRLLSSRTFKAVILLWCFAAVSILYSAWPSESLRFSSAIGLILCICFLVVGRTAVTPDVILRYVKAFAFSTFLVAIATVLNYDGGRAAALAGYDPNDSAFVMIAGVPLLAWLALRVSGGRKWLLLAVMFVQITAVLLTQSRGGFLALGAVATLLLLTLDKSPLGVRGPSKLRAVVWGCIVCISGTLLWTGLPQDVRDRLFFADDIGDDYNVNYERGRLAVWENAADLVIRRPWGSGVGVFDVAYADEYAIYIAPHNSYLQIAVELGAVAGVVFVLLWWWQYSVGSKLEMLDGLPDDSWRRSLAQLGWAWRGSVVGLAVCALFLSQGYSFVIYTIFAIGAAIEVHHRRLSSASTSSLSSRQIGQAPRGLAFNSKDPPPGRLQAAIKD
jgi:O-antigen ligase